MTKKQSLGFIPGDIDLKDAEQALMDVENIVELREILGGTVYDELLRDNLERLGRLNESHSTTEKSGALAMREALKSQDNECREKARECMKELAITEGDLCTAWHHLPDSRRHTLCEIFSKDNFDFVFKGRT